MKNLINGRRFTSTDKEEPEILNGKTPMEFVSEKLSNPTSFGHASLIKTGHYREAGYEFDFTHYLKQFVVRTINSIYETYAINKTQARKMADARVIYVLEIPKKK